MATARNRLTQLMENPNSFTGSPGFQFRMDQGTSAVNRSAAARGMRGSGNALAELMRVGQGMASEEYGAEADRRFRAAGLEQEGDQFDRDLALRGELGRGELGLGRDRLALDDRLGTGRLDIDRTRAGTERDLGFGRLDIDRTRAGTERDLGFGRLNLDRDLGTGRLSLDRDRMDRDFGLGLGRLDLDRDRSDRDFELGMGTLDVNRYNSRTSRGDARSRDFERREQLRRSRPRNPYTWEYE